MGGLLTGEGEGAVATGGGGGGGGAGMEEEDGAPGGLLPRPRIPAPARLSGRGDPTSGFSPVRRSGSPPRPPAAPAAAPGGGMKPTCLLRT